MISIIAPVGVAAALMNRAINRGRVSRSSSCVGDGFQ